MSNFRVVIGDVQMPMMKWFKIDPDEVLGEFQDDEPFDYPPLCPICGKPASYEEFQIDQDFQGNDIYGSAYRCWICGVQTEASEV